jgi:hypothetical protein
MKNPGGWDYAPIENINKYLEKCKLFSNDEESFSNFRQDPDYKAILEGGEFIVGRLHLLRMMNSYGEDIILNNIEKFKENDIYGNPSIYEYPVIGCTCPSTLLYMSNSLDIAAFLGKFQLKKIVEVGGGFGGLCKALSIMYNFDTYIMIDLPEVIGLCKRYLSNFPELSKKIVYITTDEFYSNDKLYDTNLFVAACSLAELNEETQNMYVDRLLMNSESGFIMYNTLHIEESRFVFDNLMDKLSTRFETKYQEEFGAYGGRRVLVKDVFI